MFINNKYRYFNRIKYNDSYEYQNYNQSCQNYNQSYQNYNHHHLYHHQHSIGYDADGDLTKKSCDKSINF